MSFIGIETFSSTFSVLTVPVHLCCSGQNKNNAMMCYLAWRVKTGLNEVVEMNFLIAGHTKFSCDAYFGLIKKKYRVTMVSSLNDIVKVSY